MVGLSFSVFSQDVDEMDWGSIPPRIKKWEIGFSYSPDYSYRILKAIKNSDTASYTSNGTPITQSQFNEWVKDSLDKYEKSKQGFTLGISVAHNITKRFFIHSGFYVSDKGIQTNGFVAYNGVYYGYDSHQYANYTKRKFMFLEIPFMLHFVLNKNDSARFRFNLFSGTSFILNCDKYFYDSRRFWLLPSTTNNIEEAFNTIVTAYSIFRIGFWGGFTSSIKITNSLSFQIEPVCRFYPITFYSSKYIKNNFWNASDPHITAPAYNNNVKEIPFSYGINFGIVCKI